MNVIRDINKVMDNIRVITGPMFAGKTTELIKTIECDNYNPEQKLVFNFKGDTRYSVKNNIASHDKKFIPAYRITDYNEITEYLTNKTAVIYVDEAQFIKNLKPWLNSKLIQDYLLINKGYLVICGLNLDIYGNDFNPELSWLINSVNRKQANYLRAKCYLCNDNADYTILLNENQNGKDISTTDNVLVGTKETYQPVCLAHALKTNYEHNYTRFLNKTV